MTTRTGSSTSTGRRGLVAVAAIGTAVSAGVFFDFSFVVVPALRELPAEQAIAAMRALDATAVTAPLMLLLYGTAALCVVVAVGALRRRAVGTVAASAAFLLAAVVVTGAANVPISAAIDALDPGAAQTWDDLSSRWVAWNHLRTVLSVVAAAGFVGALRARPA